MKFLAICSYLCACAALLFCLLAWILGFEEGAVKETGFVITFTLFLLPPISQFFYTYRTYGMFYMKEYKETKSLDDFLLNDIESNENIVQTNFWMKTFSLVNSILLCLLFIAVTYLFGQLIRELKMVSIEKKEHLVIWLILVVYLFSLPTVVYNLRTFNLKRIKP